MDRLHVVEICAGAGGQSLGLHLSGFDHALAVELDHTAAATLRHNLERLGGPADVRVGDVADRGLWEPSAFHGVDLLAGGVPCPPFSVAGKQLGANDERDLFAWAIEMTDEMRPRALLLENVRGLLGARFAGYRQHVIDRLNEMGYVAEWRLLQAADYGVPQLRPRSVLVALSQSDAHYFQWPEPSKKPKTVGQTLKRMMAADGWGGAEAWSRAANRIAPTIVGGSKRHGGADLGPTRAKRAWLDMRVNGMGIADAPPNDSFPKDHIPKLTTDMVARLQGWNARGEYRWDFLGRKTSRHRQIGNAFPPPVARAIGEAIASALRHEGEASTPKRDGIVADDFYRFLKHAADYVSIDELRNSFGALSVDEIHRRIAALDQDFHVARRTGAQGTEYLLVDFKAFRGEPEHTRNQRFTTARSRVS